MIPLCLVTGFLGSGKTTLLRNLADAYAGRGLVFLVNDFAKVDVDGALIREAGDQVVSIAGGSIFCTCLVTEFVRVLTDLPERHRPGGVVVEASGIADPRVVRTMLAETGLDRTYALRSVITVVDPARLLKLLHTLPNIRAQIEAADVVLVNKVDLTDSGTLADTLHQIESIKPGAVVHTTRFCKLPLDPFAPGGEGQPDGDYATCRDPRYATMTLPGDRIEVADLRAAIVFLGADLLRIKGFLGTDHDRRYIDYAGRGLEVRPAEDGPENRVVIIVYRAAEARLRAWAAPLGGA